MKYDVGDYAVAISGKVISLNGCKVMKTLEWKESLYVLFDANASELKESERNVFKLNSDGEIVWKIQRFPKGETVSSYTNIYVSDNTLRVFYPRGYQYDLNEETGEIFNEEFLG